MPRHTLLVVAAVLCATCDALRLGPLAARTLTRIGAHAADVAAPLTLETLPLAPLDAVNAQDVADAQIRRNPTPFLVVFFQDRHFQVPTSVACAGVDVTARLVAHELTKNTVFLCCSLCGTSFVKRGEHGFVTLDEMGVAPGGKFFRRECVEKYLAEGTV